MSSNLVKSEILRFLASPQPEATGKKLSKRISNALQFDNIANATDTMKEISKRAKQALRRIANESPINARRVAKYGIRAEDNVAEAPAAND